ncbi:MAG: DedA family protein [Alphaproteobacteria bacterium]|uniref:DedA family protein n=1 Tax=Candidatus Nitrobium versatile TaxID=2884831 RepID=A0A953J9D7_9BACT|nr:DedA family protein [Candidatus Nitrobium versatile]
MQQLEYHLLPALSALPALSGIVEHFPYLGLFTLLCLGAIGLPFPEDATLILCGFLISQEAVTPLPALTTVYAGLLSGDMIIFSFGRKYGRHIVTHKRFHSIISPKRLQQLEDTFKRRGTLFILFGRHIMGLRAQIFLAAGVMRMSPLKFLLADAVSALITISLMVGAGYAGGNSLEAIKGDVVRIEHVVAIAAAVLLLSYVVYKYIRMRKER